MTQKHKRISAFTKESKLIERIDVDQSIDLSDPEPEMNEILIDHIGAFTSGANDRTIRYLLAEIEYLKK